MQAYTTMEDLQQFVPNHKASNVQLFEAPTKKTRFIVAFSGGKDSIAMVLHLLECGINKWDIELHHHEVDGRGKNVFDWKCTTSYCQAFADAFDLPIYFSYRNGGIVREMLRQKETTQDVYFQREVGGEFICLPAKQEERFLTTRLKFPAISASLKTRWCSSSVKISILGQVITHSPRLNDRNTKYVVCTGERRAESVSRSKYKKIDLHTSNSQKREVIHFRPIIDFSDAEVWALMEKYKIQSHPSYMLGWGRCSCQLCIFGSPAIWATINEIDPQKIDEIERLEIELNHTLHHKQTIRQVVAKGKSFYQQENEYWLKQALGEFTAPIITDNWQPPQGMKSSERSGSN